MSKGTILSEIKLVCDQTITNNYEIKYLNYGNKLVNYLFPKKKKKVIASIKDKGSVSIIVCCRDTAKIISNYDFPNLKLIQLTSTGYDDVPVEELEKKGISLSVVKGVYDIAIAEMVMATLLQYYRRISMNPKRKIPDILRRYNSYMNELYGKKAILLGTGNIGQCIAERLSCFGVVVDGYNRSGLCPTSFEKVYTDRFELIKSLSEYDFVLSTLPLTEDTKEFCGQEFFCHMKPNALFLNVGRKGTVDDKALYQVLKEKRILGAIIDEVELFPFWPFNKFRRLPNTIVLPGIATSTVECRERAIERIKHNVKKFIAHGECTDLVREKG